MPYGMRSVKVWHGAMVLGPPRRLQRAPQILSGISPGPPRGDGEAEDLPDHLHLALCQFDGVPRLHFPDDFQHLGCVDVLNRARPQSGEDIRLQAAHEAIRIGCHPAGQLHLEPFAPHLLERVGRRDRCRSLLGLARHARIDTISQLLLDGISPLAGLGQRHSRIGAEGQGLLLPRKAEGEASVAPAIRVHQHEEPPSITRLAGLLHALSVADGGGDERTADVVGPAGRTLINISAYYSNI